MGSWPPIRESDQTTPTPVTGVKKNFSNLKRDWQGVAGFVRHRGLDMISEGMGVGGVGILMKLH